MARVGNEQGSPGNAASGSGWVGSTTGQIPFPASQAASADANTLDDYEEGTWTQALKFGGAAVGLVMGTQVSEYTKIGNRVLINGNATLTTKGSSVGAATITAVPFTSGQGSYSLAYLSGGVGFAGMASVRVAAGTTQIDFYDSAEITGSIAALDDTDFNDGDSWSFTGNYTVA